MSTIQQAIIQNNIDVLNDEISRLWNDFDKCIKKIIDRPESIFWHGEMERVQLEIASKQIALKAEYEAMDDEVKLQEEADQCHRDDQRDYEQLIKDSLN